MTDYYIRKSDGVTVQASPAPLQEGYMRVLPEWYVDWYPDGEAVLTPRACPECGQFVASICEGEGEAAEVRFLTHDINPLMRAVCEGSGQVVPADAPTTPETAGHWLHDESFAEQYAPA